MTIQRNLLETHILPSFHGVVVSCSGGPDSTALFHILWQIAKREKNFPVALLHVHYGLRGEESEEDFRFVTALAHAHGAPFFCRRVSAAEKAARRGESLQEWARRLRQEECARLAQEGWAIALGHHRDDLAETVLMRLARGTAPETLLGMRSWRAPYWRPFLKESRASIRAFLEGRGLPYRLDSSNETLDYSRNVLRHKVLPELEALFPGAAERIVACATQAASNDQGDQGDQMDRTGDDIAKYLRQTVPEAPLSRRFIAEATRQLSTPGAEGRQGPELPNTKLRLRRQPDGSFITAPQTYGLKANRARQHRRGIQSALRPNALLEPGSYASFRRGGEECRFDSSLTKMPPDGSR